MFVGAITRDSVRQALVAGITAEQMVAYLRLNVLPTLRNERGAVPLAVEEQIKSLTPHKFLVFDVSLQPLND